MKLSVAWRLHRFKLPHKKQLLGLPAGQCLKVKATNWGKAGIEQAFNPVSVETPGEVVLLVKVRHSSVALLLTPSYPKWRPWTSWPVNATRKDLCLQSAHQLLDPHSIP